MKNNYTELAKEIKEIDSILGDQFITQRDLLIDALTQEIQDYLIEKENSKYTTIYRPLEDIIYALDLEIDYKMVKDPSKITEYLADRGVEAVITATLVTELDSQEKEEIKAAWYPDNENTKKQINSFFLYEKLQKRF